MPRGRSESPRRNAAPARSRSQGPGDRSQSRGPGDRARSRSANRPGQGQGPDMSQNAMRGKRPQSQDPASRGNQGNGNGQPLHKGKRKYANKSVRRVGTKTKKGIKKVGKYGAKPVKKFQHTTLGKRIAPEEKCGTGKICSYLFAFVLLVASSIGLVIATGNASALTDIVKSVAPNLDLGNLDDPFAGGGSGGKWKTPSMTGLDIEVLNALDDSWQTIFQLAIADWEYGQPDALKLTTSFVDQDPACTPVDGKIKVCNSDYGDQPWRGIAVCIVGSDSSYQNCNCKMNDYYLKNGGADLRQYTMCHEVGHGFGLPHTDENFNNPDLGNCLDYTENYAFNKSPDESNYNKLVEFYGVVSGRRWLRGPDDASSTSSSSSARPPIVQKIPESVRQRHKEALANLELHKYSNFHEEHVDGSGWRMLHQTQHGEEHVLDLGEGYKLSVHMLLQPS